MDPLREAGYHPFSSFTVAIATALTINSFIQIVSWAKMTQKCAIAINYVNIVIWTFQIKICEVNVDDIALGNFDGFPLVKFVGVVGWKVWRGQMPTCWEALGFF